MSSTSPSPSPTGPRTNKPNTLLVALSGPSSSGKTTIAHLLAHIFSSSPPHSRTTNPPPPTTQPSTTTTAPPSSTQSQPQTSPHPQIITTLLHADDFYLPESQLPIHEATGYRNWDCAEAIDVARLERVLRGLKEGDEGARKEAGRLTRQGEWGGGGGGGGEGEEERGEGEGDGVHRIPPSSSSAAGSVVRAEFIETLRVRVQERLSTLPHLLPPLLNIILTDGFLLLAPCLPASLTSLFDTKILLRASLLDAKARRERRQGYVTLEGFWQDPEGYFEGVVWEAYVREHAWLFVGGDVEGVVVDGGKDGDRGREEVRVGKVGEGLEGVLEWCVGVLRDGVVGRFGGGERGEDVFQELGVGWPNI